MICYLSDLFLKMRLDYRCIDMHSTLVAIQEAKCLEKFAIFEGKQFSLLNV